jgi:NitT/TauT family transport system substrate-binding protein
MRHAAIAILAIGLLATPGRAEVTKLVAAKQFGLGYLQMMLMQDMKLIEKHAQAAGLTVEVEWATFRSSDVMNDALISGTVHFVSLGPTGLATIWSKTRGNLNVRGVAGLNTLPLHLNVRDPSIQSVADFKDHHRIAVPAVKVSVQATLLQMAAAKAFGVAKFDQLDKLTVSLAHPDATAIMLGGPGEIVANFSSPPFAYRQKQNPAVRTILVSNDLMPGGLSFNVIAATSRFRDQNPKVYRAYRAALDEATQRVNADKAWGAAQYVRITGSARHPPTFWQS